MTQATLTGNDTATVEVLYMALELSSKTWRLAFSTGETDKVRHRQVNAGEVGSVLLEIAEAKKRLKVSATTPVKSCYEAGRDGFWIHRWLESEGIENVVVDPSSIEVQRRGRHVKTDRLDAKRLVEMLKRWARHPGDRVWRVLRVPSEAVEDSRRVHREIEQLKGEITEHSNRIRSLLVLHGVELNPRRRGFEEALEQARDWSGQALGESLKAEVLREYQRLALVREQLRDRESWRGSAVKRDDDELMVMVSQLMLLGGIGLQGAWVLVHELLGWRRFANGKQVGSAAGLTGTPYNSGTSVQEQGISKAGNARVRSLMIELAWCWLRYQPGSALSRWFRERFGGSGKRSRRIGIVALARKLLVALWRYVQFGEVPAGARCAAR